jgi:hypothetical protein
MKIKRFFEKLYSISKVVVIITPFFLLFWLVNKDLVTSGRLEIFQDFNHNSALITNLYPENRSTSYQAENRDELVKSQKIIQDPVYFDVRLPQSFKKVDLEFVYKNDLQPLIQVGLETQSQSDWSYLFRPLSNVFFDRLNWPKVVDEQGTLWQKVKTYLSLNQFLDQQTSRTSLAVYDLPLNKKFLLKDYQKAVKRTVIEQTLKGSHSFYTYIKNEPLDFEFTIQDLNLTEGPDNFVVRVFNDQNKEIYQKQISDLNSLSRFDLASKIKTVDLRMPALAEGTYKISWEGSEDILVKKISTLQKYLTFIDQLTLADSPEYNQKIKDLDFKPTIIYSTIPQIGFKVVNQSALQTIGIDANLVEIKEINKNYYSISAKLPSLISVPKSDLKIFGVGLLAFSKDQFFDPEIYRLRDMTDLSGVDYLVSGYHSVTEENGWKTGKVSFDLSKAKITNNKLRFMVSAPELNDLSDSLVIKQIKVTLTKDPLSAKQALAKIFRYLINKF